MSDRILGIIPARAGSKRLPGKNTLLAGGKPLLAWTLEAARKSQVIDKLVVSTDDQDVDDIACRYGCAVHRRSPELASDTAESIDVVLDVLDSYVGFDVVVLLQPTSPLRTAEDIDTAYQLLAHRDSCVSIAFIDGRPVLNGAVYVSRVPWLRQSRAFVDGATVPYCMPPERSVDIDTREDFEQATVRLDWDG